MLRAPRAARRGAREQRHAHDAQGDRQRRRQHARVHRPQQTAREWAEEHPTVNEDAKQRRAPCDLRRRRGRAQQADRQHPARHAHAEDDAAADDHRQWPEAHHRHRRREAQQHDAEHARGADAVRQRSDRQKRDRVGELRQHQQARNARALETELAAAAHGDDELLERRVGERDGTAGGEGERRRAAARSRRIAGHRGVRAAREPWSPFTVVGQQRQQRVQRDECRDDRRAADDEGGLPGQRAWQRAHETDAAEHPEHGAELRRVERGGESMFGANPQDGRQQAEGAECVS